MKLLPVFQKQPQGLHRFLLSKPVPSLYSHKDLHGWRHPPHPTTVHSTATARRDRLDQLLPSLPTRAPQKFCRIASSETSVTCGTLGTTWKTLLFRSASMNRCRSTTPSVATSASLLTVRLRHASLRTTAMVTSSQVVPFDRGRN